MTSPELRQRIDAGATTVIVPIGGTEQNGPHMLLGKHNVRVRVLAGLIAQHLTDVLVAPVMAYVPEGAIRPPQGHMRFAGTISVSGATFDGLLAGAADSLCQHGFRDVVLIGDHGGYQKDLERFAQRRRGDSACRVHALTEYYQLAQQPYAKLLREQGYSHQEIGLHAGLADTSLALAVDTALVRRQHLAAQADGVQGDPRRASAELGQTGVTMIVEQTAQALRARTRRP